MWRRIPEDRGSAFGVPRSKSFVLFEVAIGDFPSQLEPSISREIRGGRSERVGIRGLAGSVTLCIRRRELPTCEVPIEREGDRCRSVGLSTGSRHVASGFWRSGNGEVRIYVLRNPETRFPELVDRWRDRWHKSGVSGFGVLCCLSPTISQPPISR
jgi:hypothetical protein